MYSTVNKTNQNSNKPSQEIGKTQPSKMSTTPDKYTHNPSNNPTSNTLEKGKCDKLCMRICTKFITYTHNV